MITTHQNPDWDAIGAVWLLKRIVSLEDEVAFVNTGNPDKELLKNAIAVVDTGKEFNPSALRFDHHHLLGQTANNTCATKQVFEFLLSQSSTVEYLSPLVDLIFQGDTGRSEANFSRELGIHALLSGFKATKKTDLEILTFGFLILDSLNLRLQNQTKAKVELAEKVVYKSKDNLIWAIKHGSAGSSFAAFEEGARVVIFEGEPIEVEGGITYPIGIMRAGEWQEPNCGELAKRLLEIAEYELASGTSGDFSFESLIQEEISKWFLHPAGFFAGRGTAKAPVFEPVKVDLEELARAIDGVWQR